MKVSRSSGALGLGERLEVEAAVESAFAPLRGRRSSVGPTRVRAAVRWGRGEPPGPVAWVGAVRRISELGVAVGVSAFVFMGALVNTPPPGAPVPVTEVEVVDDMLEAPVQELRQAWISRIVPEDLERTTYWLLWSLKRDRIPPIYDRIDATAVPVGEPRTPATAPSAAAPVELRVARLFITIR